MKKVFCLAFLMLLVFPNLLLAHSGRTASDGCHYCRTNCSSYGYTTGTRHCHNGGSSVPVVKYEAPVVTKVIEEKTETKVEEKVVDVVEPKIKSEPLVVPKIPEKEIVVVDKVSEKQVESKTEEREGAVLSAEEEEVEESADAKSFGVTKSVDVKDSSVMKEEIPEVKEMEKELQVIANVQKTESDSQDNNSGGWFWPLVIGGGAGFFIKSKMDKKDKK